MDEDNEQVLLFLKLQESVSLSADLTQRIKLTLRSRMSPRHVPNHVFTIDDIPYTNSGKKVELAVKQLLHGEVVCVVYEYVMYSAFRSRTSTRCATPSR